VTAMLETPRELVQSFADLRLPPRTDAKLQSLMDRNNEGLLNTEEREDLEALVELSESLGLLRARALKALGRRPV
jgi:hypothetical protein